MKFDAKITKLFFIFFVFSLIAIFSLPEEAFAAPTMDAALETSGTKYVSGTQTFNVNVRINTDGNAVDTISLNKIHFDNAKLLLISRTVMTLFASQAAPMADTSIATANTNGAYQLDIGKNPATANYSNSALVTFVRLTFRVISTGGGATGTDNLTIDYDVTPGTSGIFLNGSKITPMNVINQAVGLAEDNTNPVMNNCSPSSGAINVPANTSVACDVTDGETGVSLADTTIIVNGVTYSYGAAPTYSISSITNGYRITATPASVLPYNTAINISGTTKDNGYDNGPILARNTGALAPYTFTTEDDLTAPAISSLNPTSGASGVSVATNISFHIRDLMPGGYNGMGVDIDTLQITVSATGWGTTVYTKTGADTFLYSGDQFDYSITINPATDFSQNTLVGVQVQAGDLHSPTNAMATSYSFTTVDTDPPTCDTFVPVKNSTTMAVSDTISFHCKDSGVGVNIDQVSAVVNGITYVKTGASVFAYSGDSSDYLITIDPSSDFSSQYAFEVIINAKDMSDNALSQISYGLSTGTGTATCPTCPSCPTCSCGPCPFCPSCPTSSCQPYPSCPSCSCPSAKTEYVHDCTKTETKEVPKFINICQKKAVELEAEVLENIVLLQINNQEITDSLQIVTIEACETEILFFGAAQPFGLITILIESEPLLATTIADKDGQWRLRIPSTSLAQGVTHNVFAVSKDKTTGEIIDKKLLIKFEIPKTVVITPFSQMWFNIIVAVLSFCLGIAITLEITTRRKKYEIKK